MIKGSRASPLWEEAERAGAVQPGEEQSQVNLINIYKYLKVGAKRVESGSSHLSPVTGPEATGTNWNMGMSVWTSGKTLLPWGWPCTGTGCPQRGWSLHPWRRSKASRHSTGQPARGGPAWAGGWTRWSPEVLASLNHSVSQQYDLKKINKQPTLCYNNFCMNFASYNQTTHFSKLHTGFKWNSRTRKKQSHKC